MEAEMNTGRLDRIRDGACLMGPVGSRVVTAVPKILAPRHVPPSQNKFIPHQLQSCPEPPLIDWPPMFRPLAAPLLIIACGTPPEDDTATSAVEPVAETIENTGYACIGSDKDDNHDTAGVTVYLSDCLPSCSWGEAATCEATTTGDTVTVTASGSYSVGYDDPSLDCPNICISLSATCEADGLANGTFTLAYAGATTDFSGPVTETSCTNP